MRASHAARPREWNCGPRARKSSHILECDAVAARGHGKAQEAILSQARADDGQGVKREKERDIDQLIDPEVEQAQMSAATGEEAPHNWPLLNAQEGIDSHTRAQGKHKIDAKAERGQ